MLTVRWFEEGDEVVINCGLDGKARTSECTLKGYKYIIWAYAYTEDGVLKAVVKPLNTLATQILTFGFAENEVQIKFSDTPSFTDFISNNATESAFVRNSGIFKGTMEKGVRAALEMLEKPLVFKAK